MTAKRQDMEEWLGRRTWGRGDCCRLLLGSTTLLQLAFPGEGNWNFPYTVVKSKVKAKKKKKKKKVNHGSDSKAFSSASLSLGW